MIYTITLILSILLGINFLLLKFSCNKTVKNKKFTKPYIVKPTSATEKVMTNQSVSVQLAPTGS